MMEKMLLHPHAWLPSAVSSGFRYVFPLYLKEEPTSRLPVPLFSEMPKKSVGKILGHLV